MTIPALSDNVTSATAAHTTVAPPSKSYINPVNPIQEVTEPAHVAHSTDAVMLFAHSDDPKTAALQTLVNGLSTTLGASYSFVDKKTNAANVNKYGVFTLPTILVLVNGVETGRVHASDKNLIRAVLTKVIKGI